jgi:nucleoside-diphosphate-sugar epimerase
MHAMVKVAPGKTVALIGGSGFIGSTLAPLLKAAGYKVRILDITEPAGAAHDEFALADVRDLGQLSAALDHCDLIVNLAAAHRDDVRPVSLYTEVNVRGAQNVCDAAAQHGIDTIIFTSSVAIYGLQEGEPDESTPAKPFNPYGSTKWAAETVYRDWQSAVPRTRILQIVRPTVVFGPGNRGNVYNLIAQLASGFFVMVGNGKNRKSMAYVGNVAAFLSYIVGVANTPGVSVYNYCDKPDFTMNELLATVRKALGKSGNIRLRIPYPLGMSIGFAFDLIARLTGRGFPISQVRVEKFCASTVFRADRLRETGFTPPFDLTRGLQDTIKAEFSASLHETDAPQSAHL